MNKLINLINNLLKHFLDLGNRIMDSKLTKCIIKRWKLTFIILLGMFLMGGYFIGSVNSNKDKVIGKLEVALKEGDATKLSKIIKVDGKKVNKDKLEPLIDYYKIDSSRSDFVISTLKSGGKTEAFNLEWSNSLFGTTYYIELNTYNLKVKSNFDEGTFTVDEKNYINGDNTIDGIIPGIYSVEGKLESEYGDIESSKEIVLMKDEEVDVDFQAVKVKVQSKYEDSNIYVNGEDTTFKVKDGEEIGPFPTDGSASVHIENDFPWGRIKSEEVPISNSSNINLDIDMENDEMKSEIEEVSEKFYNSVFKALNEENKEYIEGTTDSTKDSIYDVLKKNYIIFKNEYTINNITIDDSKSEFGYEEGKYKATFVVNVDYKVKSFLGLSQSNNSKMFLTKFTYSDGKWVVEEVKNFSL